MQFVIEALRIQGSLSPENFQGVPDVVLFLDSDLGKDLAETARRHPAHACVPGYGEGFKHDFLNNQATDEVPLGNAAQECLAKGLPIFAFTLSETTTPILRPWAAKAAAWPFSPAACSNASATSAGSSQISAKEVRSLLR
jgi:hypothetical protein